MNKHTARVTQTVYDQIRDMSRTAMMTSDTSYNVGDRITYTTSDEPSGIDRYVSHIEAVGPKLAMVCFVWPLADATRALVNFCDHAESIDDAVKMMQVLKVLREALAK